MAHYGMLREYRFTDDVDDIRGATLYGVNDEKLGKIDDVIFDHGTSTIQYAVVDSGGWFSSKKFLVPADRIGPYGKDEKDFSINMTKEQIEALPRYDEEKFSTDKDANERDWSDYNDRYRKSLETTGDVLHRENSTHILTPDPSEMPAGGDALPNEGAYSPDRVAGVFTSTSPDSNKVRLRPGGAASRAEDSAAPGDFVPSDMPTALEDEALDRQAAGSAGRKNVVSTGNTPYEGLSGVSSSTPVQAQRDRVTNPDEVYNSEDARHRRLAAFEEHLRRNRVDITSSCRSCEIRKEDKVA